MVRTGKLFDRHIRKIDRGLYFEALGRIKSQEGDIGDAVNDALELWLNFEERAKAYCREHGWKEPKEE